MTDDIARIARGLTAKLTGGRPMIFAGFAFTDTVANRPVCYWRDRRNGTFWLAHGPWSLFRVPARTYLEKHDG